MSKLDLLKAEVDVKPVGRNARTFFVAEGYRAHLAEPNVLARAYSIANLFTEHKKFVYDNDSIAGSMRGLIRDDLSDEDIRVADSLYWSFGIIGFGHNADHYGPDYETFLSRGVKGTIEEIDKSLAVHKDDVDFDKKKDFLEAARITMKAFSEMIRQYGDAAKEKGLTEVADTCYSVMWNAPKSFREALQLVWLCHLAFCYEGRYAMALGRLDQYLYPFFKADIESGVITHKKALEWMEGTLYKIHEIPFIIGGDDVVNIAIGGVKPEDGSDATNDLSYIILEAVGHCNVPGPNLSARLHNNISDNFIDACLQVIGTGLGYPALMNDEENIPALARHGYAIEDARNYCMVGCIENFIQGKQPPWVDGRYNSPKYIELALNNGRCMLTGAKLGPETGDPSEFDTMDKFMDAVVKQMEYGALDHITRFNNDNARLNRENYQSPFLSCFCYPCIERGLDINNGGAFYPSVYGAGCMGIATMADSFSAIEKNVYNEKHLSLSELRDILLANYEGREDVRKMMLDAPKYGNNDDFVDKYAIWFVEIHDQIFSKYRTKDGGPVYSAIASNTSNIPAGKEVAATPDGRLKLEPVSDAASPMHGMDHNGPTAALNSLSKPDYTKVSCGTVVNQKYNPDMFTNPEKRAKLGAIIRTYFKNGGQELQINSVSRDILIDAMDHPEKYKNLVVRVSGFSAYYTLVGREVQIDILKRTEHN